MSCLVQIVSGEGAGEGRIEPHTGRATARAIRARLTRERCNGDRWAHVVIDGERVYDGPYPTAWESELDYVLRASS
ncbi:hypothetical protein LCGC14_0832490 [marine sediment metagenome]|uniref:Uncharacterized protein n=1 Tax=marine sediment metagenome TaxID=412755 RepID=A0A0F9PFH6_9ZZZZ